MNHSTRVLTASTIFGILLSGLFGRATFAQDLPVRLVPTEAGYWAGAGWAVAACGDYAMVGTPFATIGDEWDDDQAGHVTVFKRGVEGWVQTQTLYPPNPQHGGRFGWSIAIHGDYAIVGSNSETAPPSGHRGGAFLYKFNETTSIWEHKQTFVHPTGQDNPRFGWSVSIRDTTAVVGAPGATIDGIWHAGEIFALERSGETWSQTARLSLSDPTVAAAFGNSVSTNGDRIAVGAPRSEGIVLDSGAVHVYHRTDGTWSNQPVTLFDINGYTYQYYGYSVALNGPRLLVGVLGDYDWGGAVHPWFLSEEDEWTELSPFTGDQVEPGHEFGGLVAIDREFAVIGASYDDINGVQSGAAYVFQWDGSEWHQKARLESPAPEFDAAFGTGIAISRRSNTVLIGAPGEDSNEENSGAAYIFQLSGDKDGDRLLDMWESEGGGIDVNGDGIVDLDLYALGARPDVKDLFVECDVMEGLIYLDTLGDNEGGALGIVRQAFKNAPLANPTDDPEWQTGINLHIHLSDFDLPQREFYDEFIDLDQYKPNKFGDPADRVNDNAEHILAAKDLVYRYGIFTNKLRNRGATKVILGIGDLPGNDFVVAQGSQINEITAFDVATTLMHELGHTLGLHHGGSDDLNFKPHYISVMNYGFTLMQLNGGGGLDLDFSRERTLPALDERTLNEREWFHALDPSGNKVESMYKDVLVPPDRRAGQRRRVLRRGLVPQRRVRPTVVVIVLPPRAAPGPRQVGERAPGSAPRRAAGCGSSRHSRSATALPGSMYSVATPAAPGTWIATAMNSGPLSLRMCPGTPRISITSLSTSSTSCALNERPPPTPGTPA
jgi:hypothetical protein